MTAPDAASLGIEEGLQAIDEAMKATSSIPDPKEREKARRNIEEARKDIEEVKKEIDEAKQEAAQEVERAKKRAVGHTAKEAEKPK